MIWIVVTLAYLFVGAVLGSVVFHVCNGPDARMDGDDTGAVLGIAVFWPIILVGVVLYLAASIPIRFGKRLAPKLEDSVKKIFDLLESKK